MHEMAERHYRLSALYAAMIANPRAYFEKTFALVAELRVGVIAATTAAGATSDAAATVVAPTTTGPVPTVAATTSATASDADSSALAAAPAAAPAAAAGSGPSSPTATSAVSPAGDISLAAGPALLALPEPLVLPPADPVQLTPELAAALAGIEVEVAPIPSVQRKFRKKSTPIEVIYEGAWVPAEGNSSPPTTGCPLP